MIRHVVLWRLRSTSVDGYESIHAALQQQLGRIPGLLRVEVGRNVGRSRRSVDFCLICDFESREALAAYHLHPAHAETRRIVDPQVEEHWIADYEV